MPPNKRRTTVLPAPEIDPNNKYAPTAWGSQSGMPEDLTLPSGQLCLVKRPGMEGLVKAGVLRYMDSLTALVNEKHITRVEKNGQIETHMDMASIMRDDDSLAEIMRVVDKVVIHCVVQPPVFSTPDDVTRRQAGVIYTDMIDLQDKMFIFQYVVGGTRDLETFRGGLGELLGSVDISEGVSDTS